MWGELDPGFHEEYPKHTVKHKHLEGEDMVMIKRRSELVDGTNRCDSL